MPIYVAEDSRVTCGLNPHLFKTDKKRKATCIADARQMNSQQLVILGEPHLDRVAMDKDGYQWWIERLRESFKIYDIVRIDHFRGGLCAYWEIPAGSRYSRSLQRVNVRLKVLATNPLQL